MSKIFWCIDVEMYYYETRSLKFFFYTLSSKEKKLRWRRWQQNIKNFVLLKKMLTIRTKKNHVVIIDYYKIIASLFKIALQK